MMTKFTLALRGSATKSTRSRPSTTLRTAWAEALTPEKILIDLNYGSRERFYMNISRSMLPLYALFLVCSQAFGQQPQNIESLYIRLLGKPEVIQYVEKPSSEAIPEIPRGKEITFQWLPERKFKLISLIDTSVGETPLVIPWGISTPKISYDWISYETAFEAEMKKAYAPPSAEVSREEETKPIIGGSLEKSLSSKDLEKIGVVTSVIFAMFPDGSTATVAVIADSLVLMDKIFGSGGVIVGYNPFVGMSYVVPEALEDFSREVAGKTSDLAKDVARSGVAGGEVSGAMALGDMVRNGQIDEKKLLNVVLPSIALGVPVDAKKIEEAVKNPGKAAEKAVQHTGNELKKVLKKLPRL